MQLNYMYCTPIIKKFKCIKMLVVNNKNYNFFFIVINALGVVKKIPIEVRPRRKLGNALRSVGSFGRKQKGSSMRSALSVDYEEVEKIRYYYKH